MDALLADHAEDIVMFDAPPPNEAAGRSPETQRAIPVGTSWPSASAIPCWDSRKTASREW